MKPEQKKQFEYKERLQTKWLEEISASIKKNHIKLSKELVAYHKESEKQLWDLERKLEHEQRVLQQEEAERRNPKPKPAKTIVKMEVIE